MTAVSKVTGASAGTIPKGRPSIAGEGRDILRSCLSDESDMEDSREPSVATWPWPEESPISGSSQPSDSGISQFGHLLPSDEDMPSQDDSTRPLRLRSVAQLSTAQDRHQDVRLRSVGRAVPVPAPAVRLRSAAEMRHEDIRLANVVRPTPAYPWSLPVRDLPWANAVGPPVPKSAPVNRQTGEERYQARARQRQIEEQRNQSFPARQTEEQRYQSFLDRGGKAGWNRGYDGYYTRWG